MSMYCKKIKNSTTIGVLFFNTKNMEEENNSDSSGSKKTSKGKKIFAGVLTLVILGAVYVWSESDGGDDFFDEDSTVEEGEAMEKDDDTPAPAAAPAATGGAGSLAGCVPGNFVGDDGGRKIEITVVEKVGDTCKIISAQDTALYSVMGGDDYDKNGDGKLTMTCTIPDSVDDFDILTGYLQEGGLEDCEGEMKDFSDYLTEQFAAFE